MPHCPLQRGTNTCIGIYVYKHVYVNVYVNVHVCVYTDIYYDFAYAASPGSAFAIRTHIRTQSYPHVHTYAALWRSDCGHHFGPHDQRRRRLAWLWLHARAHTHTQAQTHTHNTHTYMHSKPSKSNLKVVCRSFKAHIRTRIRTHIRTHVRTHIRTHIMTHIRTCRSFKARGHDAGCSGWGALCASFLTILIILCVQPIRISDNAFESLTLLSNFWLYFRISDYTFESIVTILNNHKV